MARFVKRRLKEGARVLDVGCGVGAQTFWLAWEGFAPVAFDISHAAIQRLLERAVKQFGEPPYPFRTYRGDITLGLDPAGAANESFDAAIDVCCLQHITEQPKLFAALGGIRRVLKHGGWFFSVIASDRHSLEKFGGMAARRHTAANVAALFKHAQFELVSVNTKEHTEDGFTVSHWVVEAVKKDI